MANTEIWVSIVRGIAAALSAISIIVAILKSILAMRFPSKSTDHNKIDMAEQLLKYTDGNRDLITQIAFEKISGVMAMMEEIRFLLKTKDPLCNIRHYVRGRFLCKFRDNRFIIPHPRWLSFKKKANTAIAMFIFLVISFMVISFPYLHLFGKISFVLLYLFYLAFFSIGFAVVVQNIRQIQAAEKLVKLNIELPL